MAKALQFWNLAPAPGGCPYARRAWITLEEKNIPYNTNIVKKGELPQDFISTYHSVWPDEKQSPKVPTIIDTDGTRLTESQVVVEYLEQRYKQQGTQLIPDNAALAAKARLFGEIFSSALPFFGAIRASNQKQLAEAKSNLSHGLKVLDDYIKSSGSQEGGNYFLGGAYTIADVYTGPLLYLGSTWLEAFRDYDLFAEARKQKLDRFVSWAEAVLERPSMKKTALPKDVLIESGKAFVSPLEN